MVEKNGPTYTFGQVCSGGMLDVACVRERFLILPG
jgi:hypothetical protein